MLLSFVFVLSLPLTIPFSPSFPPPIIFFESDLNSSSSKMAPRAVMSGAVSRMEWSRVGASSVSPGISVTMTDRNFDIFILSIFSATFLPRAPFISAACSMIPPAVPYSLRRVAAVLSPTPGQPGKLSAESPFSARKSATCSGRSTWNCWQTSFTPITSYPPPCW